MSGFTRPPLLEPLPDGGTFRLMDTVVYRGSQGDAWAVPAGFRTDFATVPAAVSWAVPKLGAYTLAAIVHDVLCEGLNAWHRYHANQGPFAESPTANAVDTDAIFYKIARDYGTDPITASLLWVGVRWGALANPARREGWLRTAPKVLGLSLLFAPVLVPATVLALGGRLVLKVARLLFR